MATNIKIKRAALLYCKDRIKFLTKYKDSLHHEYLKMLFLEAGTRSDLAEQVPLWVLGHKPRPGTHGFDGDGNHGYPVECKTCACKCRNCVGHFGTIQINDISQNTIDKYDEEQPEIIFSFFIEGHLIAIFEILWEDIRPKYVAALDKPGRKCITLSRFKWEKFAILRHSHKDKAMLDELVPKRFRKLLP